MENVRTAYAWQEALELSKRLVDVCEAFSDPDTNVLVYHLRQSLVELPASIAADLQAGRMANMEPAIRLVAALELISRIYPAIDATDAEEQLQVVMDRMQSHAFAEREPQPETEVDEDELAVQTEGSAEAEPVPQPAGGTLVVHQVDGVHQPVITSIDPSNE